MAASLGVGVAAFCLAILAIAGIAVEGAARDLAARAGGAATVVVWGAGLESPDAAAARAADILGHARGVAAARPLDPAPADIPLARVIAGARASDPRLITLVARPGATLDGAALARTLRGAGVAAAADDHRFSTSPLTRAAAVAATAAAAAILLASILAMAAMGVGARRALGEAREVTRLLTLSGATDRFVARQFRPRLVRAAALAAAAGAGIAALAGAAVLLAGRASGAALPLGLKPPWRDLWAAAPWPPLFATVALAVGGATLAAALKKAR
ncbi:MAG: hypothetical protein ABI242_09375 [Caulobacteraceae bacterium]